ncbi:Protein phosphatase methylesterase 1 [Vanrija pseudolonga]|uniref:Protein phosphatase methylesterase 1 n=1 Tax=Vanrija pseudolonga TaxID=143232 RepID=A0AAF0XYZ3_9TREE|nr:Protein phosphatase methylesterase 1 [Vanrija pseudolonga]
MSDEFRRSILNRLPPMAPTKAPWATADDDEEDDEEELADGVGDLVSPSSRSAAPAAFAPLSASEFFEQALEVTPDDSDATFRAYLTEPHPKSGKGTYVLAHHGGGASALSFAALARDVTARSSGELGFFAFDARGHGKTRVGGEEKRGADLALDVLVADFIAVVRHVFPDPKAAPSFLLLGHSMGAAPILSAAPLLQKLGYTVCGVAVLDVVEGTAIEALPLMKGIISKRPSSFTSVSNAIAWHLNSGSIRNATSARVSVPSYVVSEAPGAGVDSKQVWRTDLLSTEPFWEGWYTGLSERFVTARCARLLVLAGQERLDRDLMVGQMQGKFQLEVMQDVGHYLHEDDPDTLATTLVAFWRRNTQVLVLPPKIGAARPVEVKQVGEA